jgi:aryl-alcohol dehydrogenase-like predicted oxidoreductase
MSPRLALGTVQFGVAYGIAGPGQVVPPDEARRVLRRAAEMGIGVLDTAAAYGNIEERLGQLAGDALVSIVSKVPAVPRDLQGARLAAWVEGSIMRSAERLGTRLKAVMFHRAEDLVEDGADDVWRGALSAARALGLKLGVSCYGPEALARVVERFPVTLAQLPGNAFDQRLVGATPDGVEIHLRSAFLQGLLLMPESAACGRLPAAAASIHRWHAWCRDHELAPITAALGMVKGMEDVSYCVIGVDDCSQLEAIAEAWATALPLAAPELAVTDPHVIDPRRWSVAS